MAEQINIRPARKTDASEMVVLIDSAGYGMPLWVWSGMRNDEPSVLEVGRERAMRDEGGISYRNAHILEADGAAAGMLICYRIDDPYDTGDLSKLPEAFRPMVELEAQVPGSWFIFVLAVHGEYRGRGFGGRLLEHAYALARASGARTVSVGIEDRNEGAYRLYQRSGFREVARRPRVPFPNDFTGSREWVLFAKPLGN